MKDTHIDGLVLVIVRYSYPLVGCYCICKARTRNSRR